MDENIRGIDHVQLTIPVGMEEAGRDFFLDTLGLTEVAKPASLQDRGGFWLMAGDMSLHIGVEDGVDRTKTKAHVAFQVEDIGGWRRKLENAGISVLDSIPIPGYVRFECRDPFGNRLEFIQPESLPADPLHPHSHDPSPQPPSDSPDFLLTLPNGAKQIVSASSLASLPRVVVPDCFIVSTGHGISGPFAFGGVRLIDFVAYYLPASADWQQVEIVAGDGFGNRVRREELAEEAPRPIILADSIGGKAMSREMGLTRLIVPSETDDALRQVKWIAEIRIK